MPGTSIDATCAFRSHGTMRYLSHRYGWHVPDERNPKGQRLRNSSEMPMPFCEICRLSADIEGSE